MSFKQMLIYNSVLLFCVKTVVSLKKDQYYCEQSSPCLCVTINNNNIDLSGLHMTFNITDNVTLNYQPCPNDENSTNTVAIEIVNVTSNITSTTPFAYYKDAQFEINDAVMLVYKNDTFDFDVILSCDPLVKGGNEYLTNFQNDHTNQNQIILKTSQVCGLNLRDAYENNSSDSWTILFSIILYIAFIYFVGGSVINACLFNKTGISMVPNHEFWSSFYNNIKEKLCGTSMMASAYESI